MACLTCEQQLATDLSALPSKWRDQLISVLCQVKRDKQKPECQDVKDCETLTTLSDFTTSGSSASVTFQDEHGVSYERSFDISDILNNLMNNLDPGCLMTSTEWENLNYQEKFQEIINKHCDCCA